VDGCLKVPVANCLYYSLLAIIVADEQQYQTLLSDHFWGGNEETTAVDSIVKAYLADIWDAKQLVIRGQAADAGAGPHGLMATGTAP
jgi:hypothetical protein